MNLTTTNIPVEPGVNTEETARGAVGRYKDCDKIRFRQGLPEKLGGWTLRSLGTTDGVFNAVTSVAVTTGATYTTGVTTVASLSDTISVSDGDGVFLFGDSVVGGLGGRTINDADATEGATVFDLSANVTASAGDALIIDYGEEFGGGTSVTGGGSAGMTALTLADPITTFLMAGARVQVNTDSGPQITTLATDLLSGATLVTLTDALIDDVDVTTPNFFLYAPESLIISSTQAIAIRRLNSAVAASTLVQLTEGLPIDSDGYDVDIRPLQTTTADGDQSGTSITFDDATTSAVTTVATFPDGLIIAPANLVQDQTMYLGFARAIHDWVSLDEQKWAAIGTDVKLYLINNDTLYDITPLRDSGALATDPFRTDVTGAFDPSGSDSSYVEVTDIAHGGQVGNYVRFAGATDVGGISLNGEFTIVTVVDPDTYVIQSPIGATSTATGGGGSVTYEYDIDVGPADNTTIFGYGAGGYGLGGYGIGVVGTGIEVTIRIWSLDNFGEDLLASPNGKELYWWDRTGGPTTRATLVTQAPATIQRMLVSPEARHVIALGAGTGSASSPGDQDKLLIRWASSEDFTDWISLTTNSAGDLRLDNGSEIITAVESRGDIIIFTDESLHALQYIGRDPWFSIRHLGQSVAIIGANAAVDVNGIVRFMGEDDFLIYDGVLRVMQCDVRNQVFENINRGQGSKVFSAVNKLFTEVWWFYPSSTSTSNDRYVKYNYKDNVWDFGTITRSAFHDSSSFYGKPYGLNGGLIYQHETGVDDVNTLGEALAMTSFVETWDVEIDANGSNLMHVGEMVPDFKILEGSIELTLKGRGYPARPEISKGPFTVTSLTETISPRFRTRQVSFRVESDAIGDNWRMGQWRAGVRPHGRRGG